LRLQHHARDHHGAENRPAAGFVDAEDHGRYGFACDVRFATVTAPTGECVTQPNSGARRAPVLRALGVGPQRTN
jgi:hypothetical protein